jgi:uncharacterized protein YjiS (DUF1127 family)
MDWRWADAREDATTAAGWARLRRTLAAWRQRIRDRCTPAELSVAQRRDIGLALDPIDPLAGKPSWHA